MLSPCRKKLGKELVIPDPELGTASPWPARASDKHEDKHRSVLPTVIGTVWCVHKGLGVTLTESIGALDTQAKYLVLAEGRRLTRCWPRPMLGKPQEEQRELELGIRGGQ